MRVDGGIDHVRHHHRLHPRRDAFGERAQVVAADRVQRTRIDRLRLVGVGGHRAVAGEVLEHRGHPGQVHAAHVGRSEFRSDSRIGVEGAHTDRRVATRQVCHRGEAEIHAAGAQLAGHHPGMFLGEAHRLGRIALVHLADSRQRRQAGEARAEALHRAAFLVHRDQQPLAADLADRFAQRDQLRTVGVVACEQDHARHAGRDEPGAFALGDFESGQTDQQHQASAPSLASRSACVQQAYGCAIRLTL